MIEIIIIVHLKVRSARSKRAQENILSKKRKLEEKEKMYKPCVVLRDTKGRRG